MSNTVPVFIVFFAPVSHLESLIMGPHLSVNWAIPVPPPSGSDVSWLVPPPFPPLLQIEASFVVILWFHAILESSFDRGAFSLSQSWVPPTPFCVLCWWQTFVSCGLEPGFFLPCQKFIAETHVSQFSCESSNPSGTVMPPLLSCHFWVLSWCFVCPPFLLWSNF